MGDAPLKTGTFRAAVFRHVSAKCRASRSSARRVLYRDALLHSKYRRTAGRPLENPNGNYPAKERTSEFYRASRLHRGLREETGVRGPRSISEPTSGDEGA